MRIANSALLLATTIFLAACAAGPRYQMFYRYEAPADAAGRACLARCEQHLRACQNDCKNDYAACIRYIEPEAKARHADALKRYAGEIEQYYRDLDRYHMSLSLGWGYYDGWYGHGWYDPWWPYGGYYGPHYYSPEPPQPPSYADELAKLRSVKCDRDCACQPDYDACFLGCGGRKVPERRCITNCPPDH